MTARHLCTIALALLLSTGPSWAFLHDVSIQSFAFNPQSLTIQPGDSVRFTNLDSAPHTVTSTGGIFDSGMLTTNMTFVATFPTAGSYGYVCLFHSNMSGVINVGSSGGGDTSWVEQTSPTSLPLMDVRFIDAQRGWIAGKQGMLRTTNGGETWTLTSTPEDLEAVYFINANEGWACGNDGYLIHTTNGGQSWSPQTSGAGDKLRDIWFADAQNGWAVGKDGIFIRTINGGQTWTPQVSPATDDLRGIHMITATYGWVVGSDGLILFTDDGNNWDIQLSVPGGEEDEFESIYAHDANHAWAVGGQGRIYYTVNGGQDWMQQTSGTTVAIQDVHFSSLENGWACGAGGYLSNAMESGTMWHTQTPPEVLTFNSVFFASDSLGFLVSGDGRIFRREITGGVSASPEHHHHQSVEFELLNNYPNPFNPATTIEFNLSAAGLTTLTIFDILGQQIAQPVHGQLAAGSHRVEFVASGMPSGAYFYQLSAAGRTETRKMLLLK